MREIQGYLANMYGTQVSLEFISSVTDAEMAEVGAWHAQGATDRPEARVKGAEVSHGGRILAQSLGARDSVLCVCTRSAPGDLHDQRH